MGRVDKIRTLAKLHEEIRRIQPESSEDEGAAEYYGEVNSVVMAIKEGATDEAVVKAAEWVGLEALVVFA